MPDYFSENLLPPLPAIRVLITQEAIPVIAADGADFEMLCVRPATAVHRVLHWLPAMGVPARHYVPLAEAMAAQGIAVIVHEWRGIGSSDRRAGRHCDWGYRELLQDDLPAGMAMASSRWPQQARWIGGHSLGGQLAALYASLHPAEFSGLVLVAGAAPYWRCFRYGWLVGAAYVMAPLLANLVGHLPGRRIGFGGNEARGLIADWSRSGRTGCYAAAGMHQDLEQQLALLRMPVLGLRLRDDWLVPLASLHWLLAKMPLASHTLDVLAPQDMNGHPADHFSWMKAPAPVAARLAAWIATQGAARAREPAGIGAA